MAFRRSTFRRATFRRKRVFRRKGGKRLVKTIKRVAERAKTIKVSDVYMTATAVSSTGFVNLFLQDIARQATNVGSAGEDASRTTNRIRIHSLEYKFQIVGSQTNLVAAGDQWNTVRWGVFKYHGRQIRAWMGGTSPYSSQPQFFMTGPEYVNAPFVPVHENWSVLHDRKKTVVQRATGGSTSSEGPGIANISGFVKGKFLGTVRYDGDTINSDSGGGLVFWLISDSGVTPYPTVDGYVRIRYTDC